MLYNTCMTDEIEEFDAMLEAAEDTSLSRRSSKSIDALVINQEIAAILMSGVSVEELASELNVSAASIYKRINKAPMQDLLHIEARRVLRHLSTRDLYKEKYLGLATALGVLVDKERQLRDVEVDRDKPISKTQIDQINLYLFGRGIETKSPAPSTDIEAIAERVISEIPSEIEQEGSGDSFSDISGDSET